MPFVVVDADGAEVEPVSEYLRELMLGDLSPATCRSYAHDLLRWFRLLWLLGVVWDRATRDEVAALVGWLRLAPNPQRARRRVPAGRAQAGEPADGQTGVGGGLRRSDDQSHAHRGGLVLRLPPAPSARAAGQPGPDGAARRRMLDLWHTAAARMAANQG